MIYHIYARGDEASGADSQSRLCIIKHTLFHAGFLEFGWMEREPDWPLFRAAPRGNSRGRCSLTFYAQEKQEEEEEVVVVVLVEREKIRLLSA